VKDVIEEPTVPDVTEEASKGRAIRVQLQPHADMEVRAVTGTISNFVGDAFIVTHIHGLPPAFRSDDEVPETIEAKVLFRGMLSIPKWAEFIDKASDQLARMRREGLVPEREPESDEED